MRSASGAGRRALLVAELAAEVDALPPDPFVRVAVDGMDGAGKSTFAAELALALRHRGRTVAHASVDGFHHPRALRHARGRHDPEGFYRDSHDLAALERELLDPFGPGGHGVHRSHVFDVRADRPDVAEQARGAPGTVLVVDGVFLHRPELRGRWSWSLWLEVDRATSLRRCVTRDGTGSPDPTDPINHRYVEGQRRYLRDARPQEAASHVVDNGDLDAPTVLR